MKNLLKKAIKELKSNKEIKQAHTVQKELINELNKLKNVCNQIANN